MSERQIGLRKRTRPFTQVPNDVVDDWTIGYRELGILVRILRMPEGFVIRSEQLSTEGKGKTMRGRKPSREGREAVRTALRNLALSGYYRLVRQRMLDGTFAMATDITEDPDAVWAAQAAVFGGRPVPLVEQSDGTFNVKYPDGTLLPDGDMPPADAVQDEPGVEDEGVDSPKPRNPSPGNRTPGNPASGEPGSGNLGAIKKMVSKDGQKDSDPASQGRRSGSEDKDQPDGQIDIDGQVSPSPDAAEVELNNTAMGLARSWADFRAKHNCPIVMRGRNSDPLAALRKLVLPALRAGYTEADVKNALMWVDTGLPSDQQFDTALGKVRAGWRAGHGWKPGDGRGPANGRQRTGTGAMAGTNRHVDDISAERRAAENPFQHASRQSDYVDKGAVA
jgi:hypothetical protein